MVHYHMTRHVLLISLCALIFAGPGNRLWAAEAESLTPLPANPVTPQGSTIALGFLTNYEHGDNGRPINYERIGQFAREIGRSPAIINSFSPWKKPDGTYRLFPAELCDYIRAFGAMPLITWPPGQANAQHQVENFTGDRPQPDFDTVALAAGKHDEYIKQWALSARNYGHPLMVRLMHEMIAAPYPWSKSQNRNDSPARYVAAFRHIVDIFKRNDVSNVQFVWCIGVGNAKVAKDYYPGDDYVDWVSLDGYNTVRNENVPWRSFQQIFGNSYKVLTSFSARPVMIAEVSTVQDLTDPERSGKWFEEAILQTIPREMPRIKAVVFFNSKGHPAPNRTYLLTAQPESFATVKRLFQLPQCSGTIPDKSWKYAQ
jgi:beta-mannanase